MRFLKFLRINLRQRFINNLIQIDLSTYERTIDQFIKFFSKEGIGLYKFGKTNNPGISDLDLIIVYPDEFKSKEIETLVRDATLFIGESRVREYIFTHPIIIYPESLFKYIKYVHTVNDLINLNEIKKEIIEPPENEKSLLENIHFVNFTYNVILWLFDILKSKQIFLRELLLALGSASHSLEYIYQMYKDEELISLNNSIKSLRDLVPNTKYSFNKFFLVYKIAKNSFEKLKKYLNRFVYDYLSEIYMVKKNKEVFMLLESNKSFQFVKIPIALVCHGASFAIAFENGESKYKKLHYYRFPFDKFQILDEIYKKIIKIQMQVAYKFEPLYQKFKLTPMAPFMCCYSEPVIKKKTRNIFYINKILLNLMY